MEKEIRAIWQTILDAHEHPSVDDIQKCLDSTFKIVASKLKEQHENTKHDIIIRIYQGTKGVRITNIRHLEKAIDALKQRKP